MHTVFVNKKVGKHVTSKIRSFLDGVCACDSNWLGQKISIEMTNNSTSINQTDEKSNHLLEKIVFLIRTHR
jgi:hypothetical protein